MGRWRSSHSFRQMPPQLLGAPKPGRKPFSLQGQVRSPEPGQSGILMVMSPTAPRVSGVSKKRGQTPDFYPLSPKSGDFPSPAMATPSWEVSQGLPPLATSSQAGKKNTKELGGLLGVAPSSFIETWLWVVIISFSKQSRIQVPLRK